MAETYTVHDPFKGEPVTISSRLVDRLRGKYAVGPTLENGEPEFGWQQRDVPAIQVEAAAEIERLQAALKSCAFVAEHGEPVDGSNFGGVREWIIDCCAKALE